MPEHATDLDDLLPGFIGYPQRSFVMGTPERDLSALAKRYGGTRESYREESPQHTLILPPYAIAAVPVINALYATFVVATAARPPISWHGAQPRAELLAHPVTDVNWHEARAFCDWLSGQFAPKIVPKIGVAAAGARVRLPSEAEWEQAARGHDGRSFPWGEDFGVLYANTREAGLGATTPVGAYVGGASPSGALDMAGNVWEWTASLDRSYPYRAGDGRENAAAEGRRILRGGCYANPHGFARCACRFRLPPGLHNDFIGFRLALDLVEDTG
jgi:formylglycine-generating enzyme required for sulfatase activity